MKRLFPLLMLGLCALPLRAQPAEPTEAYPLIYEEGMERSQIMETLHRLTDVYGARLTGSPNLAQAGQWVLEQLEAWGLRNAHAEPWDWGHVGWTNEQVSVHMLTPDADPLVAEALGWTPSTDGAVTGPAYHLVAPEKPTQADLDAFFAEIRDDVVGKIVLVGSGAVPAVSPRFEGFLQMRQDDAQVQADYEPSNPSEGYRNQRPRTEAATDVLSAREVGRQVDAFLKESGALVQIDPARMENGLIRAFSNRTYDPATVLPTLVMRSEDYGRIERLLAHGHEVTLEVEIANTIYPDAQTEYNYIAEIPGAERPDEVVMLGGHLDAWHASTGATDNASGSAVMMEAARILQAVFEATGTRPRRTIRVALWTGEEQGLRGSQAYVADHFGSYEDPRPEFDTFGGYFNVDSGTGRLRGATVFGPTEAAQVLEDLFAPLDSLGVAGARPTYSRSEGGSDHASFSRAGLPGIRMGQDPIHYYTHTWHTNVDTYERILEDDVKQAAVVVAAAVYGLAMREELLPRFPDDEMPATRQGSF